MCFCPVTADMPVVSNISCMRKGVQFKMEFPEISFVIIGFC